MKICPKCAARFDQPDWICPTCDHQPALWQGCYLLNEHDEAEIEGYRGEYFAPLAAIEAGHFWFETRNRLINWGLKQHFPAMQSFLEIGCGTGFVLQSIAGFFPQTELAAAEYYIEGIEIAQQRVPRAAFYQLDARKMPFEQEFDVLGAFDVIEHIEEDEQVLRGMHQAVKKGGGIVLTVPQHRFLWSVADDYKHHVRRYERAELEAKVRAAGFRPVYASSFISSLLPVMLLSRLRQNQQKQKPDRMTELQINGTANAVLDKLMKAETGLIQAGLKMPLGGSLLLIAKKD